MHKISLIAVLPCGNVTIFHVVEILKYGLLYVFITQLELIHEVAHRAHIRIDTSEDMVVGKTGEMDDALDIRRIINEV